MTTYHSDIHPKKKRPQRHKDSADWWDNDWLFVVVLYAMTITIMQWW